MSAGSIDGQIGFEDVSAEYQAFVDWNYGGNA